MTAFRSACHISPSQARSIQVHASSWHFLNIYFLILSSDICLGLPTSLFPLRSFHQNSACTSPVFHTWHCSWYDYPKNVEWEVETIKILVPSPRPCEIFRKILTFLGREVASFFFFRWRYSPLWALACRTIPPLFDFRNDKFFTVWGC
jgi:hypothetical protein